MMTHISKSIRGAVRLAAILPLFILLAWGACSQETEYIEFEGLEGPEHSSELEERRESDWTVYRGGGPSRLAVLLTDSDSAWTGLVHGLAAVGIPFTVTDSVEEAVEHEVVLGYPILSGAVLDEREIEKLRSFTSGGGTLVGVQVLGGGLKAVFGYGATSSSKEGHAELEMNTDHPLAAEFTHPRERTTRLGNPARVETIMGSYAYVDPSRVVAAYQNGGAAITDHRFGEGRAIAVGFDIGFFLLKGYNDRDQEASRIYINGYEPSIDVLLRLLKHIYRRGEQDSVTLWTVPEGKRLSVIISHDVDYSGSLSNSLAYARYERSAEVSATYFMQTKYYRDYFDEVFFDDNTEKLLARLSDLGMEIASHSVSHTDQFAALPLGTGNERYPEYQPRVLEKRNTRGATVLGELRVSKFLLEHFTSGEVVSFRSGFLAYPNTLPQALEATGYRYSSSIAAGNAMTHFPFRLNYGRRYRQETQVFEFPISIEDEKAPRMDRRVDQAVALAEQLSTYGASCVVLIHPNVKDYKLRFLKGFVPKVREYSWFGTFEEFGDWWAARDALSVDVYREKEGSRLVLRAPRPIAGLILEVPQNYHLRETASGASQRGSRVFIPRLSGTAELRFSRTPPE